MCQYMPYSTAARATWFIFVLPCALTPAPGDFIHTGSFPVKSIAPMYCGDLHCMVLNYEA